MLKDIFENGAAAFEVGLVHHVPGRLRLRSVALRGNSRAGEEIRERLAAIAGLRSITANPETGSLLLEYDPAVIAPGRIADLLAAHGVTVSASTEKSDAEPRPCAQLVGAIKAWAFDALAEHLVLAIIGAIA